MAPTEDKGWAVVGWDTFKGREYPVSQHSTEADAQEAGRKQLLEIARDQPSETSGGPDGIQDRIYITGPNGIRYRLQ